MQTKKIYLTIALSLLFLIMGASPVRAKNPAVNNLRLNEIKSNNISTFLPTAIASNFKIFYNKFKPVNYNYALTNSKEVKINVDEVTRETFRSLNPLVFLDASPDLHDEGRLNVAGVINRALKFIFPIAGLILFVMIIWGGFEILTGADNQKSLEAGKQRITAAIIGFFLLLASYWIIQIIEYITGVIILV